MLGALKGVLRRGVRGAGRLPAAIGRLPWQVWAAALLVAVIAYWASCATREMYGNKPAPDDVRNDVRRMCQKEGIDGGKVLKRYLERKGYDKYDKDDIEGACKRGSTIDWDAVCPVARKGNNCQDNYEERCEKTKNGRVWGWRCCQGDWCDSKNNSRRKGAPAAPPGGDDGDDPADGLDPAVRAAWAELGRAATSKGVVFYKTDAMSTKGAMSLKREDRIDLGADGENLKWNVVHNMWGWDDKVAYVHVPDGMKVVLYADPNGAGDQLRLGAGLHTLKNIQRSSNPSASWLNAATSYKIGGDYLFGAPTPQVAPTAAAAAAAAPAAGYSRGVTFYQNSDGTGEHLPVQEQMNKWDTVHNLPGNWNDKFSSVYVPDGMKVILYQDGNGGGKQLRLGPGTHDLGKFQFPSGTYASWLTCNGNNSNCWNDTGSSYKFGGSYLF